MRVLTVIHAPTWSGLHTLVARTHEPLERRGIELNVAIPADADAVASRFADAGVKAHQVSLQRPRLTKDLRTQARFFASLRADVAGLAALGRDLGVDVVASSGVQNVHALAASKVLRRPYVLQLNSSFIPRVVSYAVLPQAATARAILTEGKQIRGAYPGLSRQAKKLFAFYPGVDPTEFRPDAARRAAARATLGIGPEEFLVGTVGNFVRQKGHEDFVEAAAQLRRSSTGFRFVVVGQEVPSNAAYYASDVRARADRLGLSDGDMLRFLSSTTPIADILPAFDVFLLTSRAEGVATATLEALASGVPVVAYDVGSVSEAVAAEAGIVVPPNDVEAICAAVRRLEANRGALAALAAGARSRAESTFTPEHTADAFAAAYHHAGGEN
jgi:glycosyltransferase involved in cell wall biosynthesis